MRNIPRISACLLLAPFWMPAPAQESSKPNLSGTWQFNPAKSENRTGKVSAGTWVIDESNDTIHITESDGNSRKVELRCTTNGKECDVAGGEKAKASFWYNGPMLVEMEQKGEHATRYRMKLSDDGKLLTVEITYIVPQVDKSDVLVFDKQP